MGSTARVVVVGGGPAAVESLLALQSGAGDRARLALIAPEPDLVVRAYEVLSPFQEGRGHRYPLTRVVKDAGAELVRDALASVDPDERTITFRSGATESYDELVIAIGARMVAAVGGAVQFQGARDAARLKGMLIESHAGHHRSVAFIIPGGHCWALPLYELALHTATWLREREVFGVPLIVVSPESGPLSAFGGRASSEVASLLEANGIQFVSGHAVRHEPGSLLLAGGRNVEVGLAIALPRLTGPAIHGLPHDQDGFLPVDAHGRVNGAEHVFGAGDVTNYPIKQGGLATQQADGIAALIVAQLTAAPSPEPLVPVLRAVLYGGRETRYLRARLGEELDATSEVSSSPLWPESSKLVGLYLSKYLDSLDAARVAK
jgi:sulfide:quinone oxidoreductase